ncbi:MAG: YbfB/YjiJ family MFS transporter [Alphaproteobacteria bacterium]|nr:YbfB/YjiJ family MFS transporter [Alphaproteobacteria bacterium]
MGQDRPNPWRATGAALAALLVGIGLARFAYTPLIPAVIAAGWFSPAEAAYLGAANLVGYVAGALAGRAMARRLGPAAALRAMMLLAAMTFFASAAPVGFAWFFLWRFASGVAGGAVMALAAPMVLPHVPAAQRGLAGGVIFTGVGLGVAASGTLVPLLIGLGLAATWIGLGAIALALTLLTWRAWPAVGLADAPAETAAPAGLSLRALYLEYAVIAFGLVPHMVFLADFVARGLDRGLAAAARYWVAFGIGAMAGPVLAGLLADRAGFARALRLCLAMEAVAVTTPVIAGNDAALLASSLAVGAFVPGVVPLVLGRTRELCGAESDRRAAWRTATVAFALGQAGGAYALSVVFDLIGGSYALLFAIGAAAIAVALAIDLLAVKGWRKTRGS